MSSSLNGLTSLVPKLDSKNYATWKTKMEMVLIREKLWGIVCERKTRPEAGHARQVEWDEEAERATATIFLCLSESAEKHVQDLRNPVEIWNKLQEVYEARGFSARFLLWRNLFSLTLAGVRDKNPGPNALDSYIDELTSLRQQLKSAGFAVPDEVIVSVLLSGLDSSWESFISATTQSYRQQEDIDPDTLIHQLLDENRRRAALVPEIIYPESKALKAQKRKHIDDEREKRRRPECSYCDRKGHSEKDCWKKYPEKRPETSHCQYVNAR